MGTTYSVKFSSNESDLDQNKIHQDIDKILVHVNALMSTYIPTSEISRLNQSKKDIWFPIHKDFFHVLSFSMDVAKKTQGSFDPTLGPLVNLWGFGPDGKRKVPSKDELENTMSVVGHDKIELDQKNMAVKKSLDKVYVDLSASAKGYGVDAVSDYLLAKGIHNFMVEIGGEIRTSGQTKGRSWRIAIEAPHPDIVHESYQKVLPISNKALATSGDYRNFFVEGGKKYSHTIDFKTGKPARHTLASVSVVDESSCMKADAWATAFMAMGPVKAFELAEKLQVAAYFIYRLDGQKEEGFVTKATSEFKKMFEGESAQ